MQPFKLPTNETFCECKPRYLYYPETDSCYEAYRNKPCNSTSQYFILDTKDQTAKCEENPCKTDGYVEYEKGCYPLQSIDSPCGIDEVLNVNETTFQVECAHIDIIPFIVVQVPKTDCPSGSRRNYVGICTQTANR